MGLIRNSTDTAPLSDSTATNHKGALANEVLAPLRANVVPLAPAKIGTVGIPTRDRPAHLANCVGSLVENAKAFGRKLEIVVIDVSAAPAVRRENRARLGAFCASAEIRYCGPGEREAYWRKLGRRGVHAGDREAASRSSLANSNFGAARNALLLDQAGEAFLSADDDVIARTAIHPFLKQGIRFIGGGRCFDSWYFRDRASALDWARWERVDIVGQHAALLGQSTASLATSGARPVNLDGMCGHFTDPGCDLRVVGTVPGKVGDSGRGDPAWDIWAGNWLPGRGSLARVEVAELADSIVIAHHFGLMTTMAALDARMGLPPFFSRYHSEDRLFATLLGRVMPNACWGVVPHGIVHDRPQRKIEQASPCLRLSDVLWGQLSELPLRRAGCTDADAIVEAGGNLCRSVEAGPNELRHEILERLAKFVSRGLGGLQRIAEADAPPERRAFITLAQRRLVSGFIRLCGPEPESEIAGFSWDAVGRDLAEYGRLLQHWPEILQVARDLRADCVRPSIPLEDCC
jgi:hypothetical protein